MELSRKISSIQLKEFSQAVLSKVGVSQKNAAIISDNLISSNLRGVDTHGIRLLPTYARRIGSVAVNPKPRIRVVQESPSLATIDGDNGPGQVVAWRAMRLAIDKAKETGIALVSIRRSGHCGAMAYYTLMASDEDLIGIAGSNSLVSMVVWGGAFRAIGNNPLAIAVPTDGNPPFILDMATSVVSWNKIYMAAERGDKIPFGWALNIRGEDTDDPNEAKVGGPALPIGGPKGSGIAIAIDILSGVLSGGAFGRGVKPFYGNLETGEDVALTMAAMDISKLMPVKEFKKRVGQLLREVKEGPLAKGFDMIRIPGERAEECRKRRLDEGIPLDSRVITELESCAREFGVEVPF